MLRKIGVSSIDDLFADIPESLRFSDELDIPLGIGEAELARELGEFAARNVSMDRELSFLGYGFYDHYVPAVCAAITSRSEFATAYTPYQPEISQGTLQAIFEFQTAISELTGLPVSNASLYDGATAAAEALYLCEQVVGRSHIVVSRAVSEPIRAVLRTYARAYGMTLDEIAFDPKTGITPPDAIRTALESSEAACVVFQQPNAFGNYEAAPDICAMAEEHGAVGVAICDPLSLGVLEAPGVYGAGIAVGDGQALGNHPGYGGPSFGFMGAQERFIRRMPGRIVGESRDVDGTRAFTLTLQTREQHIRREKATSNICTNQALCALSGIVYMSWLGPHGLERMGGMLADRTVQLRAQLAELGIEPLFSGASFKETAFKLPITARAAIDACKQQRIHPGFDLSTHYPELGDSVLLVAVTEQRTDEDLAALAAALGSAVKA
jgi:glycine dehydrogenase subunit 1